MYIVFLEHMCDAPMEENLELELSESLEDSQKNLALGT